jgi:hypothetical protein
VIVTEWSHLDTLASDAVRTRMNYPLIVDGRNVLDPETVLRAGFVYEGIGARLPAAGVPSPPEPSELLSTLTPSLNPATAG